MGSGQFHNMTIGLSPSHAGFSGGANFSGGGRGYSGAGSADQLARMRQGPTHPESQRNATVAMHREARPEGRFMVLARDRKIEPLPSSLHGLQIGLELTTFPVIKSGVGFARKSSTQQRAGITAKGATRPGRAWSRQNAANRQRLDPQTKQRLRNWQGKAPGWNDAKHNHDEHWRDRHHPGHDWWHNHCDAIVLVGGAFWGWYDGWWYPTGGLRSVLFLL